MTVTATGSVFWLAISNTARRSFSGRRNTGVVAVQLAASSTTCRPIPASTMTQMFSADSPTSIPRLFEMLIHTIAMSALLFVRPNSTLYFFANPGAEPTFSRTVLPAAIGTMMLMTSFRSRDDAASAISASPAPAPESAPGAELSTAFKMKGTVNTPSTFVVTVSMSASAPFPAALVTSVTPLVSVVGTHAKARGRSGTARARTGSARWRSPAWA